MGIARTVLVLLLFAVGVQMEIHAQPWSTELPTPQGGDYGNGAATSDVAGGVFMEGGRATSIPAISFGIPTGFGADWRDVFAAAGLQLGLRYSHDFTDGAVFGGAGVGDAQRNVGFEVTLAVVDLVGETFKDRTLGIKLHRRLGAAWSLAVGIENMIVTGTTDGGTSAYGVVSGALPLDNGPRRWLHKVIITAGVGDGRFNGIDRVRRGENGAEAFGSVAVRVLPRVSALATWTGQDLNAGISIAPFPQLPLVVTPVLLDLGGRTGSDPHFALSTGIGLTL